MLSVGIKRTPRNCYCRGQAGNECDKVRSDDINKLIIVNECVCFARAGNAAIKRAIQIDIEKAENASSMRADDVL